MKGFPSREQVERIKAQYPEGTRVCCEYMPDDPTHDFLKRSLDMERVIFWNNKGGTGKTTLSFQTITEYAQQNKEKKFLL